MKRKNLKKINKSNFSENIRRSYADSFNFIKESRFFIYLSIFLFFASTLFGFFYPFLYREEMKIVIREIMGSISQDDSAARIILLIFLNNIKVAIISVIFGIFYGVIPFFLLLFNGYIVGFVSSEVINSRGFLPLFLLVPHGIFEIPAIIISTALGMKIGFSIFTKENPFPEIKKNLIESLKIFVFIIFPLILLAGIIEGLLIAILR